MYSSLQWSIGQLVLGSTNSLAIVGLFGEDPQLVNSVSFSCCNEWLIQGKKIFCCYFTLDPPNMILLEVYFIATGIVGYIPQIPQMQPLAVLS